MTIAENYPSGDGSVSRGFYRVGGGCMALGFLIFTWRRQGSQGFSLCHKEFKEGHNSTHHPPCYLVESFESMGNLTEKVLPPEDKHSDRLFINRHSDIFPGHSSMSLGMN